MNMASITCGWLYRSMMITKFRPFEKIKADL